ncbi:hypothetical protein Pse7367_1018 [Thalassoporum mexicanum PCC 7367]|uniref:hypothetical protein n=1 Tax=Thalassoporum mexicanum TaxID=3457544 RepID=UPI00029FEBC3|nr:hypothetical protein [Pseudanabaena sp. PCC 7367]AFY69316.1 hypothetical protein Pse7367_1018 [Pseudanabaena sp. PCC 7367]
MKRLNNLYPLVLTISLAIFFLIGCSQAPPNPTNPDPTTDQQIKQEAIAPAKQVGDIDNQSSEADELTEPPEDAEMIEQAIAEIPTVVTIADQQVGLDVFLWRDFQPISPADGKPMLTLVKLVEPETTKSIDLEGLAAKNLWVFNGADTNEATGEIWATQLEQQLPSEYMARQGPKWEPGTEVNVVVELVDAAENVYLLKAEQQIIQRTD